MISVPPMMIAHPAAHYPQMPWAAAGPDGALQPVFLANPAEYQQMMQQQRPGSVDSESSKSSSRRGSLSKSGNDYNKFVPSMKKMQLGEYYFHKPRFQPFFPAEIEEMAQQADRMRISEKKIRERRPSNGSSADSGTGGFPVSSTV